MKASRLAISGGSAIQSLTVHRKNDIFLLSFMAGGHLECSFVTHSHLLLAGINHLFLLIATRLLSFLYIMQRWASFLLSCNVLQRRECSMLLMLDEFLCLFVTCLAACCCTISSVDISLGIWIPHSTGILDKQSNKRETGLYLQCQDIFQFQENQCFCLVILQMFCICILFVNQPDRIIA